jgi:CheY-like chemotaxis protein
MQLGRNSVKFLQKGFIRLRVVDVEGSVHIYVEDSGPGIPPERRKHPFAKIQKSVDVLNHGAGIGLSVCKHLAELMGAEIWCDETYDSGIDGCPGARFVVNLKKPPLHCEGDATMPIGALASNDSGVATGRIKKVESESPQIAMQDPVEQILPDSLSVMFVDDDFVLRKLFIRAVKKVAPEWQVEEAANGETALQMIDDGGKFDLIFMDQYMASVEKQLLGTEATRALRSRGVTSKICGLSANDTEESFLEAGANAFMMKPFPCDKMGLTRELLSVLYDSIEIECKDGKLG